MTDVVIAGIGQTEVGEHWDISLRDLAFAALRDAVKDAGGLKPQALFVGNMLAPNLSNQAHLGVLIADYAGLLGVEAVTVEAAGASGGAALRQGYLAVASGMVDVALVLGVEKFTDKIGPGVDAALARLEARVMFEQLLERPPRQAPQRVLVGGAAQVCLPLRRRELHRSSEQLVDSTPAIRIHVEQVLAGARLRREPGHASPSPA